MKNLSSLVLASAMLAAVMLACPAVPKSQAQVSVPQSFVDQADTAFKEVVADRAVIEAKNQALASNQKAIDAQDSLIRALTDKNKLLEAQNADLAKLKCSTTSFLFGVVKVKRCH